ncbi:MAG: MASE3 domain-containing protein [bacterium]
MLFNYSDFLTENNLRARIILYTGFIIFLAVLSINNFLLFHSVIEFFSIIVAYLIFVIILYSYEKTSNNFLIFLGIAYGFVAGFDFIHTLTYKGMGIFPEIGSNLPTQLWITARFMESLSLLIAFKFLYSKRKFNYKQGLLIFTIISLITGALIYFNFFPDCYIEGYGLTTFKIISEYIIAVILLISLVLLKRSRKYFKENTYKLMKFAIMFTIISEIAFTLYISVYDISNIIGHFFKLFSFYFIFQAIIKTGIKEPYNILFHQLNGQKEKLEINQNYINSIIMAIPDNILIMDKSGELIDILTSSPEDDFLPFNKELINKKIEEVVPKNIAEKFKENIGLCLKNKRIQTFEYKQEIKGKEKFFEVNVNTIKYNKINKEEILIVIRDITDRKMQEKRLKREKEKIQYYSFHDQLTDLYNRRYFENELERLNYSRRLPVSIVVGDMDGLKTVNDNYGHRMGDKYLKKAADVFSNSTRTEDIVARIGGDEFAVILPETDNDSAQKFCDRLKEQCNKCNKENDLPLSLSISIGCATVSSKSQDLNEVFVEADRNMYENKGRSNRV